MPARVVRNTPSAASLLAVLLAPAAASAQYSFAVVARAGFPVEGQSGTLTGIGVPLLDSAGRVAFKTPTRDIMQSEGGTIRRLVTGTGASTGFTALHGFGGGRVLAHNWWSVFGNSGFRTDYGAAGSVAAIQGEGGQVPGYPAGTVWTQTPSSSVVGPAGHAAFSDTLLDAIFRIGPGYGLAPIAKSGLQSNGITQWSDLTTLGINSLGTVLFRTSFWTPVSSGSTVRNAATSQGGAIASTGETAPGGGGTFSTDGSDLSASLNDAGQVAVTWRAPGQSAPLGDAGIWRFTPGTGLELVVREGQNAPGSWMAVFGEPRNYEPKRSPAIGGNGDVAFIAPIYGPFVTEADNTALFVARPGSVTLVAREGDPAPGSGTVFEDFTTAHFAINAQGEVYFWSDLDNNMFGIFRKRPGQPLEKVMLTGEELFVEGQMRPIVGLTIPNWDSGTQDGRGTWINDSGQAAIALTFQDLTSAIVLATPVAPCYANCDGSTIPPVLNVNDFVCFQTRYAAGDSAANCDGSSIPPVLNVNDFICFQTRFAQGCP